MRCRAASELQGSGLAARPDPGPLLSGAAQESNLPPAGLRRATGFEDRVGHQPRAAPRARIGSWACRRTPSSATAGPRCDQRPRHRRRCASSGRTTSRSASPTRPAAARTSSAAYFSELFAALPDFHMERRRSAVEEGDDRVRPLADDRDAHGRPVQRHRRRRARRSRSTAWTRFTFRDGKMASNFVVFDQMEVGRAARAAAARRLAAGPRAEGRLQREDEDRRGDPRALNRELFGLRPNNATQRAGAARSPGARRGRAARRGARASARCRRRARR